MATTSRGVPDARVPRAGGLPQEDAPRFVTWVTAIFSQMANPDDHGAQLEAATAIREYFIEFIADRRATLVTRRGHRHHLLAQSSTASTRPGDSAQHLRRLDPRGTGHDEVPVGYSFYHFAAHPRTVSGFSMTRR